MSVTKLSSELEKQLKTIQLEGLPRSLPRKIHVLVEVKRRTPVLAEARTLQVQFESRITYQSKIAPYIGIEVNADKVLKISQLPWIKKLWHAPKAILIQGTPVAEAITEVTLLESQRYIAADWAKSMGYNGNGIVIGVIDSGMEKTHPMLEGQIIAEGFFAPVGGGGDCGDVYGHGTWCGACVAGKYWESPKGPLEGVAPQAKLLNAKIFADGTGFSVEESAMPALEWVCEQGAHICSNSWGLNQDVPYPPLHDLIQALVAAYPTILVFAAGNNGPYERTIWDPATYPEVVTVGSILTTFRGPDTVAVYSSRGPTYENKVKPDIMASGGELWLSYGECIISAGLNGGTKCWSGTSMATPHIAGAFALLLEAGLTPSQAISKLFASARDLFTLGKDNNSGYGVANIGKALNLPPPITHNLGVHSNPLMNIPFTIDSMQRTTPYTANLGEIAHAISMPQNVEVDGINYCFKKWSDGLVKPFRSVNLLKDMTVSAEYAIGMILFPSDDAFVSSVFPSDVFDTLLLLVGYNPFEVFGLTRTFLKFDLTTLPATEIISALLHITVRTSAGIGFQCWSVEDDWDEKTLTYNNQPPSVVNLVDRIDGKIYDEVFSIDLTTYIQERILAGLPVNICLKSRGEESSAQWSLLSKKQAFIGYRPWLEIIYGEVPTHILSVNSSPIIGVPVSINGIDVDNTPFQRSSVEGTHIIEVPEEVII